MAVRREPLALEVLGEGLARLPGRREVEVLPLAGARREVGTQRLHREAADELQRDAAALGGLHDLERRGEHRGIVAYAA